MSDVSVDIIKNRNGEAPDLPSGANLSGVSTAATLQVTNLNPTHINASGVTTATTFSGSMKSTGKPTLGLGVTINSSGINISGVATAGIVSATTLYGDGSNLTGVAMSIAPVSYNPDVGDSSLNLSSTGIGITFTERIIAGSGNITLRIAGAGGTVVENFGVGSSVTINNNTLAFTPTNSLSADTYYVDIPAGSITNTAGDLDLVSTSWTFSIPPQGLWSWGYNQGGQLGQNSRTNYSSPVQITGAWTYISDNGSQVGGLKGDNTLWMWGDNTHGALGDGSNTHRSSPVQIPGTTWSKVITNPFLQTAAIKTDGTLWSWGYNDKGALGLNNKTSKNSPTQVPGTTWSDITGGEHRFLATKTDGTLWTWGKNALGEGGQNNTNDGYSSPVQIPGTTWSKIGGSNDVAAAIKTDGTLWTWGFGGNGGLGNNGTTNRSSPIQIPGTTWTNLGVNGCSRYNIMAFKTDGTMWVWGLNIYGELGQNESGSPSRYSSPVQIPGTTWDINDYKGSMGATASGAIKTDGTLWVWGRNQIGELGLNSQVSYSSPVQIPGTTWTAVNSSKNGQPRLMALKT